MEQPNILPEPNTRVHIALTGGHYFNGTCLYHAPDRHGIHAVVLMDCGVIELCHGLNESGVGWYAGPNRRAHHPSVKPYQLS